MYLNIFLLTLLIVFVLDCTDFYDNVFQTISKALTHGKFTKVKYIKPFSCSLCMSWWCGLAYLLIVGALSVGSVAYVALMAFLTPIFKDLLFFVRELLTEVIDELSQFFNLK